MRKRFGRLSGKAGLATSAALIAMAVATPASAQGTGGGADVTGADAPAKDDGDNIIVTARRREERLVETPISVTAFSEAAIQSIGVNEPANFLDLTPGVFFRSNTTSGTAFINIRGVSASRNAESPVAVIVDGVFLSNPLAFQNQLVDIQQIEVLKGPQGALYGRNASAGAIVVTTKAPTNEFEGFVRAGYGRHNWRKLEASLGGAIVEDKLFFRATGYHRGTDGYLRNRFLSTPDNTVYGDEQQDFGGRLRLLYTPNSDLTFDLRAGYTETDGGFNNTVGFGEPEFLTNTSEDFIFENYIFQTNVLGRNLRDTFDLSMKVDWDTDFGTFTSISSYTDLNESGSGDGQPVGPTLSGTQTLINEYETFSQEIRFASDPSQPFRFIVGGFYQNTNRLFAVSAGVDTGPGIVINNRLIRNPQDSVNPTLSITADAIEQEVWSIFGQAELDLTDNLEVSVALRYDEDEETATNLSNPLNPNLPATRDVSFARLQPKFTISYNPSIDSTLFLTYAEGFKNGGFNPSGAREVALATNPNTFIQNEFGEEVNKQFELGFKSNLFDNRVTLTTAAYYSEITGVNFFDFILEAFNQVNLNIDEVQSVGAEVDVSAELTDTITTNVSFSYNDSEIKEFRFNPAVEGNTAPAFPDFTLNVGLQWQDYIGTNLEGFFRADVQHVGEIYWDVTNIVRRAPQTFLDMRFGVNYFPGGNEDDPLRIELFCQNCTNNDYVIESLVLADIGTGVHFLSEDARIYGIELTKRF